MVDRELRTFLGMDKTTTYLGYPKDKAIKNVNIRIVARDTSNTTFDIVNEKGNSLVLTLPTVTIANSYFSISGGSSTYSPFISGINNNLSVHYILGDAIISKNVNNEEIDHLYLFTFNTANSCGIIWEIKLLSSGTLTPVIKYIANNSYLNWSINGIMECYPNIETQDIRKIYYIDSINQLRFFDINNIQLDTPMYLMESLPIGPYTAPIIRELLSGGSYKAGVVQYAFNVYNKNGSQSKISPISQLVRLGDGLGGLSENQMSGISVKFSIKLREALQEFYGLKVYAVYRTVYEQDPQIILISDIVINSQEEFHFVDAGTNVISYMTTEEFLMLGGELVIPETMDVKDKKLFFSNYKSNPFIIPEGTNSPDFRAFAFSKKVGNPIVATVWDLDSQTYTEINDSLSNVPAYNHDCINIDWVDQVNNTVANITPGDGSSVVEHIYQANGTTYGGEGLNITYEITTNDNFLESVPPPDGNPSEYYSYNNRNNIIEFDSRSTSWKRGEIYRFAIQFLDTRSRWSNAKWVADIKIPESGDVIFDKEAFEYKYVQGSQSQVDTRAIKIIFRLKNASTLKTLIKNYTGVDVVRFRVVYVQRDPENRSILTQGIINSCIEAEHLKKNGLDAFPDYFMRSKEKENTEFYNLGTAIRRPRPMLDGVLLNDNIGSNYKNEIHSSKNGNSTISINASIFNIYSPELQKGNLYIDTLDNSCEVYVTGTYKLSRTLSQRSFMKIDTASIYTVDAQLLKKASGQYMGLFNHPAVSENGTACIRAGTGPQYEGESEYHKYHNLYRYYTPTIGHRYTKLPISDIKQVIDKNVLLQKEGINPDPSTTMIYSPTTEIIFLASNDKSVTYQNYTVPHAVFVLSKYDNTHLYTIESEVNTTPPAYKLDILGGDDIISNSYGGSGYYMTTESFTHVVEIRKKLYAQYGGFRYEDKLRNVYIPASKRYSDYTTFSGAISDNLNSYDDAILGDVYLARYDILRSWYQGSEDPARVDYINEAISFLCESTINLDFRADKSYLKNSIYQETLESYYLENKVYNQKDNLQKSFSTEHFEKNNIYFPYDIIPTFSKVNGELIDSWTDLQLGEYYTMPSQYGKISKILVVKDNMICFQPKGISVVMVNPKVAVATSEGEPIEFASGAQSGQPIIVGHRPLTDISGCIHKKTIKVAESGVFYFDYYNSCLSLIEAGINKVSILGGMDPYFRSITSEASIINNMLLGNGIIAGYHVEDGEYYISFKNSSDLSLCDTVVFNERLKVFTSHYTFYPALYINHGKLMLTSENGNGTFYKHWTGNYGRFYEVVYPSSIRFASSPVPGEEVLFTNLNYSMITKSSNGIDRIETFSSIQAFNSYGSSPLLPLTLDKNVQRKNRKWRVNIPKLSMGEGSRMIGPYCIIELIFNNTNNYSMSLGDFEVYFLK